MTKVILQAELKGRGGEGDVIEVARGYANNFLLPQKLAILATAGELKQLEARKHKIAERETKRVDSATGLLGKLDGKTIKIEANAGDEGVLFGSVTTAIIAEAIAEQLKTEVDRKRIDLAAPIHNVGTHGAVVSIYRDLKANVIVEVVSKNATADDIAGAAALAAELADEETSKDKAKQAAELAELEAEATAAVTDEEVEIAAEAEVSVDAVKAVEAEEESADDTLAAVLAEADETAK